MAKKFPRTLRGIRGALQRDVFMKSKAVRKAIDRNPMVLQVTKLDEAYAKKFNEFAKEINESDSRIIQEFNLTNIKRKRGLEDKEIYDFLFNLAPSDPFKLVPIEKPISMSASKHIGYAIQWFGLSVVLVVMTLIAFLKKNE